MNNEELANGISNIDDDIIAITSISRKRRSKKPLIIKMTAMAACICLILCAVLFLPGKAPQLEDDGSPVAPLTTLALEAEYPDMPQYPTEDEAMEDWDEYSKAHEKWWEYTREVCGYPLKQQLDEIDEFFVSTASEFLADGNGENVIYSPINVYYALAMLAETAAGESREQILELLGADSVEGLRQTVNNVWRADYRDDGTVKSIFANSLWLNDKLNYNNETLGVLRDNYFASSYSGEMGSDEYTTAFKNWLNEQTGGLLKDQVAQLEDFTPETVLTLASTVYYKASWQDEFHEADNTNEVFHSPKGDKECEFMNQSSTGAYYYGENFSAVGKGMRNYGSMYFILPDEGVSAEQLLEDGDLLDFIVASKTDYENQTHLVINLKIPKFDVSSSLQLVPKLQSLGVTDVFGREADLSAVTDSFAYVSSVDHSARVKIDEEGCEAAAFTVITDSGASMPKDEVDFVLDRPFIFVITSQIETPLFIGIVNNP